MYLGTVPFFCGRDGDLLYRHAFGVIFIQFFIITAAGQEFAVSPLFDDLALIDDEEKIGVTNGRQAMGDDDARPAFQQLVHGFLDFDFGAGIDVGRRFIEDQDAGID